jgi:Protein tyrosine and serine/threonine kinase
VLSGQLPYHQLKRDTEVLFELDKGVRPSRPPQLVNEHWGLICLCWMEEPSARPDARDIFERVQHHHSALSATEDRQVVHSVPPSAESTPAENGGVGRNATPSSLTLVSAFLTIILSHIIP